MLLWLISLQQTPIPLCLFPEGLPPPRPGSLGPCHVPFLSPAILCSSSGPQSICTCYAPAISHHMTGSSGLGSQLRCPFPTTSSSVPLCSIPHVAPSASLPSPLSAHKDRDCLCSLLHFQHFALNRPLKEWTPPTAPLTTPSLGRRTQSSRR